jgi:acid phosphatase type 7
MIGAGDIAVCGTNGDEATGRLIDSLLVADSIANIHTEVFTLGDNAYPSGSGGVEGDFPRCFAPSWGSPRVMRVIHPAPGNHDYDSGSAAPYFAFFGDRAGPAGRGYYSYDVGAWHAISLDSELYFEGGTGDEARAQEDWLRRDLAEHPAKCTLAYFHRPPYSSGLYGGIHEVRPLWKILYDGGADLVLTGHEHDYERFAPQNATGGADSVTGMQEIIAGTGGGDLREVRDPLAANSVVHVQGHFGILKLALGADEYRYTFIDVDGRIWDTGGRKCH